MRLALTLLLIHGTAALHSPSRTAVHTPLPPLRLRGGSWWGNGGEVSIVVNWKILQPGWDSFRDWSEKINGDCITVVGDMFLSATVLEGPIDGEERHFWVVLKFQSASAANKWRESAIKKRWVAELKDRGMAEAEPEVKDTSMILPFIEARRLQSPTTDAMPPRWKEVIVSWLLLYACALTIGPKLLAKIPGFGMLSVNAQVGITTLITCALLTYVLMPRGVAFARAVSFFPV